MKFKTYFLFLVMMTAWSVWGMAQVNPVVNYNDSLSLQQILQQVLERYPSVLKAEEAVNSAEAGIGLARSGYYPTVTGTAGYTRVDPVPELTIPNLGRLSIAPNNNYNAGISIYETLYDFNKTSMNIKLQESSRDISEKNVGMVKQRLTQITSICFYNLVYLQEAIMIKQSQIDNLQQHLDFVKRKAETGSSTQYEILSTQVRLSNAINQKVDIEASRQTQTGILNSLLGQPVKNMLKVRKQMITNPPDANPDSLINFALDHRYELVIGRMRQEHAKLRMESVKIQNYPVLNAFISGGVKNGYIPDLNQPKLNWAGGVGLNVPIFDATRHKFNMKMANTEINIAGQDFEESVRTVSSEVYQNQVQLAAALQKIDQGKLQVRQAEEALNLAQTSFQTGSITNLDLLDSETALAESRVNLLRAQVDYAISVVRLEISIGQEIR
ncbi:MAG: TolC family protein [Syntrophothermus sp.]